MTNSTTLNHMEMIPDVFKGFVAAHTEIVKTGLKPSLRHLIELRASQINQCGFCVKMHTEEALKDGETSTRIERIMVWRHVDDFTADERAALAWTEALTHLDEKTDYAALRADMLDHFEPAEVSSITSAISMINLWNRMNVANH